ncbi:Coenzyme PQQ synthesis protein D [Roseovarius sp. EC-HK134]|uniref:pyrroloquinoline quinone biosynthesis peptide chaperone PqqD n=1 Tax=unclassified Roseovarius TaxID=2614913 RepID=UPI0012542453|nr:MULTISPECIES: pyrroloquinoline quinone biosynthesis peptide chaperone PqqD [unclassified Roseovarius]VVT06177.1 Coenzyme PQQ synthesis protein D [Roseovarius sp. EC-SD190]VVT06364.1 Coenzyme PQQ synthesis protein D [Roseovarius sp. EC-HK134]
MTPNSIPHLPRGVRLHYDRVREDWVLLAPERAVRLDPIGHAILSRVDGVQSFGALTADLAATYNAPLDDVTRDSAEFLQGLAERRFLEMR